MNIRFALERDIPKMLDLLAQVCLVHHNGRPDLFGVGTKYGEEELRALLKDAKRPILVAIDDQGEVLGYCFCILQRYIDHPVMTDVKTLYIDDLCVDESARGQKVGTALYEAALDLARTLGCYNLTLNVWSCNESALKFYRALGMVPQKIGMEVILQEKM